MPQIPLPEPEDRPTTEGYEVEEMDGWPGIPKFLWPRLSAVEYYPDGAIRAIKFVDPESPKKRKKEESDGVD